MKTFRKVFPVLISLCIILPLVNSCKSKTATKEVAKTAIADNQLTDKEVAEGWVSLFDGKSFDGWRGYGMESFPDTGWIIEDGAMKCIHSGLGEAGLGGDILYDKEFKNFYLKLECKIEAGGNSGIFYLGKELEGKKIWYTAPEMQILDNANHPDAMLGKDGNRQAGALYDLIPAVPQNAKAAMEWNAFEIMVYDGTVVHKMNGETVLEYHLWTEEWNSMIKNSKFPEFNPDFANVPRQGYICLQDHGHAVWFKNIKIKEL